MQIEIKHDKHVNINLKHHTTSNNRGKSLQGKPLAMSAARRTTLRRILRSPHVSEFPASKKTYRCTNEMLGTDYNQIIKHEQTMESAIPYAHILKCNPKNN